MLSYNKSLKMLLGAAMLISLSQPMHAADNSNNKNKFLFHATAIGFGILTGGGLAHWTAKHTDQKQSEEQQQEITKLEQKACAAMDKLKKENDELKKETIYEIEPGWPFGWSRIFYPKLKVSNCTKQ